MEYRNKILEGNCLEVLRQIPDNTFTAVVTDPPYGLSKQPDMKEVLRHWLNGDDYNHDGAGFMGKEWDSFVPGPKIWEEIMRVLKPGGHILSFSGTRTYDLMCIAMRIAGAEIRDKIDYQCDVSGYKSWVYGSGFPKSLNIGKAIDKKDHPDAKKWEGYGTALKPAHEPVIQFSKSNEDGSMPDLDNSEPFKYQAKAGKKERNKGCVKLFWNNNKQVTKEMYQELLKENESNKDNKEFKNHKLSEGNVWPTVKPIDLCRYLVKMVKMPEDNLILDPFCGSGTTLIACILEGCNYTGIDMDPQALEIANARVHYFKCLGESGLK